MSTTGGVMIVRNETEEVRVSKRMQRKDVDDDEDGMPFILDEREASSMIIIQPPPVVSIIYPQANLSNCASGVLPPFSLRGPNYLVDRKKYISEDLNTLFPFRGADLFLTKNKPEHIGRNAALFSGHLRDTPTFLINFRLPWGVLVLYFEIPKRFLPFLQERYEPAVDVLRDTTTRGGRVMGVLPSLDRMSPGDKCACRFLLGDDEYKNKSLKILPRVADGPWVVKSVVGNTKPAIIGNKLPVTYFYQPKDGGCCCYLEVDLDIAASVAARKILSVVRSSTQGLTFDVGFLCEGKHADELPEQMMVACRLHGVDPFKAPPLPSL